MQLGVDRMVSERDSRRSGLEAQTAMIAADSGTGPIAVLISLKSRGITLT
ncbi:MAG: hypothetical protein R3C19_19455 [Planctomycetaceae bacterium]